MTQTVIEQWHSVVASGNPAGLDQLLHDDVVFHSPVVHTPQRGKTITRLYLGAAFSVLANESFNYVREVVGERDAVLEFTTVIDGISINGIDMIRWNESGQITDFKVMVRPLKAVNLLHQKMAEMLQAISQGASGRS